MTTPAYTTVDVDSSLAALLALAAGEPALAGLSTAAGSPDLIFFRALALVDAKLAFLENNNLLEAFGSLCRLRQSMIEHARSLGYDLGTATAATATLLVEPVRVYRDLVPIPAGTVFTTEDGSVTYESNADAYLPAGGAAISLDVTEGRTWTETATGVASGSAPNGQTVALARTPFLARSEVVVVNGVRWTRVTNFLASDAASRHYRVVIDADDRATVHFGDGTNGYRPPVGATITLTYRVGGGTRGRVGRNRLTRCLASLVTAGGHAAEVTCTNPAESSGGTDRETIAHARYAAPASVRATDRTIAREDFELHAEQVAGVDRALCHTRNENVALGPFVHRIYVLPDTYGTASAGLLAQVEEAVTVTYPTDPLNVVEAVTAVYRTLTVNVTLTYRASASLTNATANAVAAIEALFDPTARDPETGEYVLRFGHTVPRSRIIDALQEIAGVESVVVTSPASDATLSAHEFPKLAGTPSIVTMQELA